MQPRSQDMVKKSEQSELALLYAENARLAEINREAFDYIRRKANSLLEVVGTKRLRPEEMDDYSLIGFDPIGIVAQTFQHVLENLQFTNQKLRFAHDEIRTVFDTVGAALLVLDPQGKVVSCNQKVRDLMLEDDVDVLGKRCRDSICHNNTDHERCVFEFVMRTRREQSFDDWELNEHRFDVIGRPMFDAAGKITHVVMAYHDVSARRDAQNALLQALNETQEVNTRIHSILRSAADGILVTDADKNVVLINRRAEELIGLSAMQQGAFTKIDCIPHDGLVTLLRKVPIDGQDTFIADLTFQLPGHSPCVCQATITAIKSSNNEFNGCITILRDVTEQRTIDRMKNEFVSTAAHELRTPLATIIGYTDLLMMKNDFSPEQKGEFIKLIQKKAERLGDIVSDLLDISRIEAGEGVQLDPKPHRIDQLCEEVVKGFQLQTKEHDFVLELSQASGITVVSDRFAMMQILENLLSNAVKYSPRGGEIHISCQLENGTCVLTVGDQGLGMTSEQVVRIFDKFYRVDATNTAISGTGLGMTIVKHLVEAQAGQVSITSSVGKGTTVTITLPVTING